MQDLSNAIALIQATKSLYADSGIDIDQRIKTWCDRSGLPTDIRQLNAASLEILAEKMHETYLKERLTLTIVLPVEGYGVRMPISEWIEEIKIAIELNDQKLKRRMRLDLGKLSKQDQRSVFDGLSEDERSAFGLVDSRSKVKV